MVARLRYLVRQGLARFRWPLAGVAALVIVLACVLVVPQWLVRWELGAPRRAVNDGDKAKAINDVRTTLLQGIGGAVLLLGARRSYRSQTAAQPGRSACSSHRVAGFPSFARSATGW